MIVVAFLLIAAVAVFVYVESQPKVIFSGHRWELYPNSGNSDSSDSESGSPSLAYDGNVKLFTLLYTETLTDGQGERIREAVCHVLIDLPPEATLQVTGGGSNNGALYRTMTFVAEGQAAVAGQGRELTIQYHVDQKQFAVEEANRELQMNDRRGVESVVVAKNSHGPFSGSAGNVFFVRIDEDYQVNEIVPIPEVIPTGLDEATVSRLIDQVESGN